MGLLTGKTALIFGVANERSLAWGIAKAFHEHGATLGFGYSTIVEKYARPLAEQLGVTFFEPCDVASDEEIAGIAKKAADRFGQIDILVHSIAYANKEELTGPYYRTSRAGFHLAMDISAYSFVALANAFQPIMRPGGALVTLSYYGAEKVTPGYNVMGVAKAALEASTRYLAYDLGREKIRVNAISAGPVRTLAASGVGGFKNLYKQFADMSPLKENISSEDVGNAAVYLCSDLASHVTGEVVHVDSGYHIVGVPEVDCSGEE
jgi:enoyl-[acyl-carrier protein] reductase I